MLVIYSILIACAAVAYSSIITEKYQLLHGLHDFLERKLPKYLFFPLIGCHKCVAGQWGLWLFLFYFPHTNSVIHIAGSYDPIIHAWFILQCIFNAAVINELYIRIRSTTAPLKKHTSLPPELQTFTIKNKNDGTKNT